MIVYKATNKINDKSYIGQTVHSLRQRKYQHDSTALSARDTTYFHRAIKKYGSENFSWEIIHDNISNIEELNKLEIFYIGYYNTFKNGYNLTFGGSSISGFKHSKESKKKMSEAHKGEKSCWYGRKHTEKSKRKMSEMRKGKKISDKEAKRRILEAHRGENHHLYGKHRSEKVKRKISKSLSGKNHPMYGKHHLEESKRKMSEARKGENNYWYGKSFPEEMKNKMSEAKKIPIMIGNKHFSSRVVAAEFVGVTPAAIRYRILHKTKWSDYKYMKKGE